MKKLRKTHVVLVVISLLILAGSVGIMITSPGERPTFEELIKRTDELMYIEKRRRKALKK